MPSEMKHLIEISDIQALVFECTTCGTSVFLSQSDRLKNRNAPAQCPGCMHSWADHGKILALGDALLDLKDFNREGSTVGFALKLEITTPMSMHLRKSIDK